MKPMALIMLRLPEKMLAGAEADLEPHIAHRDREESAQARRSRRAEIETKARQQLSEQASFRALKGLPLRLP